MAIDRISLIFSQTKNDIYDLPIAGKLFLTRYTKSESGMIHFQKSAAVQVMYNIFELLNYTADKINLFLNRNEHKTITEKIKSLVSIGKIKHQKLIVPIYKSNLMLFSVVEPKDKNYNIVGMVHIDRSDIDKYINVSTAPSMYRSMINNVIKQQIENYSLVLSAPKYLYDIKLIDNTDNTIIFEQINVSEINNTKFRKSLYDSIVESINIFKYNITPRKLSQMIIDSANKYFSELQ